LPQFEQHKVSRDLPTVLDAAAIRDLRAEIEPFVSKTTLLTLNTAAVECLGTQAAQLFVATARALDMNGGRLAIVSSTSPLSRSLCRPWPSRRPRRPEPRKCRERY